MGLAGAGAAACCLPFLCASPTDARLPLSLPLHTVRCGAAVVLVSLLQLVRRSPVLAGRLPALQATFTALLGDANELTQVCGAGRGWRWLLLHAQQCMHSTSLHARALKCACLIAPPCPAACRTWRRVACRWCTMPAAPGCSSSCWGSWWGC